MVTEVVACDLLAAEALWLREFNAHVCLDLQYVPAHKTHLDGANNHKTGGSSVQGYIPEVPKYGPEYARLQETGDSVCDP